MDNLAKKGIEGWQYRSPDYRYLSS